MAKKKTNKPKAKATKAPKAKAKKAPKAKAKKAPKEKGEFKPEFGGKYEIIHYMFPDSKTEIELISEKNNCYQYKVGKVSKEVHTSHFHALHQKGLLKAIK